MIVAYVIFNPLGFPMITHVNPERNKHLHMAELLDRVEDMSRNVSQSVREYYGSDDEFLYYVALLPKQAKLVVMTTDDTNIREEAPRYLNIAKRAIEGNKDAIKELLQISEK